jgi:hypothetical protein
MIQGCVELREISEPHLALARSFYFSERDDGLRPIKVAIR